MGADIHTFIEYKIGDGPWFPDRHHAIDPEFKEDGVNTCDDGGRNYYLFAALAGVRGEGPEPKGLPNDISHLIAKGMDNYGSDGHSHSYDSLDHFEEVWLTICVEHGWKIEDGTEPIAFGGDYDRQTWPNFIAYCKQEMKRIQMELESEKHLLGAPIQSTEVQCRILYFFDN